MNKDNIEKVDTVESPLTFTYKLMGRNELKIADNIPELLKDRDMRSIAGKYISIFNNGRRVGEINCQALLWSVVRERKLVLS